MTVSSASQADQDTRKRILDAAGPVFARAGYRDATVRDLCVAAEVNLAAVNYHFGSKRELYAQTLAACLSDGAERAPLEFGLGPGAGAPERLLAFVQAFLLRTLGEGPDDWRARLVAREMLEPAQGADQSAEEWIRPMFKHLCAIVAELLGEGATPSRVILCARSVIGQCAFYHHSREALQRVAAPEPVGRDHVLRLAHHITSFSLAALGHPAGLVSGETKPARNARMRG